MWKRVSIRVLVVFLLAATASAATWSPLAPLPAARCADSSAIAVVNNNIILVDTNTHDEYSIAGNSWSANTPSPRTNRTNFTGVTVGNDVFFVGNTIVTTNVDQGNFDQYNQVTDGWTLNVGAFFPNAQPGLVYHGGSIYSFGGTSFGGSSLAFRFVPGSTTIFVLLSVPTGRSKPAVAEFGGKLWVIGGTQSGSPVSVVEIYDPVFGGAWSSGPALPVSSITRAAGVVNGDLHVLLDAGLYRLQGGSWTQVGPPAPLTSNYAAVFAGDNVHVAGGCGTGHYAFNAAASDTTPPSIASITPSIAVLNPPNHKMVPVTISVAATDDTDPAPTAQIVSVTSNEPDDGLGDGDTSGDIVITVSLCSSARSAAAKATAASTRSPWPCPIRPEMLRRGPRQ